MKPLVAILYMTVFCMVSPVGVGVGMALTDPAQVSCHSVNILPIY